MPAGVIKKIVRASLSASSCPSSGSPGQEGYGIITGSDGRDVFFVNSAVIGSRFEDLRQGQAVQYTLEEGPLGRAASVSLQLPDIIAAGGADGEI